MRWTDGSDVYRRSHLTQVDQEHGLRVDENGKAFIFCPTRFDVRTCSVHKLLQLMGSGAFPDGQTPESGEYTVQLVQTRTPKTHGRSKVTYDSWLTAQLISSNKEH